MARIINDFFPKSELEIEPFDQLADVSDTFQLTLARLLAFYRAGEEFRLIEVNSAGELLVSLEGGQVSTGTIAQVTVNTTATLLIVANTARTEVLIENMGVNDCYIGFDSGVTTANGFLLPAGVSFSTDRYIGNIYGIRDSANPCVVSVMEL